MKWIKKVASTPMDEKARVIDSIAPQVNDRTNAPSIHAVYEGLAAKWSDIYPVGSIYMSVNNVDPAVLFGGTWQQIKDKFLLASGDTYNNGATGGSATTSYTPAGTVGDHALTVEEMPLHSHTVQDAYIESINDYWLQNGVSSAGNYGAKVTNKTTTGAGNGVAHNHSFTGTAATLDNMPPYLAVNVWVRTA